MMLIETQAKPVASADQGTAMPFHKVEDANTEFTPKIYTASPLNAPSILVLNP